MLHFIAIDGRGGGGVIRAEVTLAVLHLSLFLSVYLGVTFMQPQPAGLSNQHIYDDELPNFEVLI